MSKETTDNKLKSSIMDLAELNRKYKEQVSDSYADISTKYGLPDVELSFVFGDGIGARPVVLLGEAPGKDEVREGRPFVGAAGKILDDLLIRSGIDRASLYITNTVKYRLVKQGKRTDTFANRPVKPVEIDLCSEWLLNELKIVRPRLLLTLGNTALKGALNCLDTSSALNKTVGEVHGMKFETILKESGHPVLLIPLYHPASLIYNRTLRPQYEDDLEGVKKCVQLIL